MQVQILFLFFTEIVGLPTHYSQFWSTPLFLGGARGVMVIVTGYGHGDTSSIPGQDSLHFT